MEQITVKPDGPAGRCRRDGEEEGQTADVAIHTKDLTL